VKIVVQKFGGSVLASSEARQHVVSRILEARKQWEGVVVVLSAIGRSPQPYATDTLLNLISRTASPRHKDLLASCGEIIACVIMADLLEQNHVPSEVLPFAQIGILTDNQHEDAEILEINPTSILAVLNEKKVAVVPGFQGISQEGRVTTLGRGGSDITACALGAALKAECVELYKDVEGIYSADPRVVPEAKLLSKITYQEVGEMAYHGAKVLHPKAVSFAMQHDIPIRVCSAFSKKNGTLIGKPENEAPEATPVKFSHDISGIAHIPKMAYVEVKPKESNQEKARYKLFEAFAKEGISLDLITVSPDGIWFIIQERFVEKAEKLLSSLDWSHTIQKGFAKVSVIGAGMRGKPGVMFRVVDSLQKAGISLFHSTDSHITIACLVKEEQMEQAVQVLHAVFIG
jgi:aspartate kinase